MSARARYSTFPAGERGGRSGQAPEPRRTRSFHASSLRTEGPYSLCRHPLYTGNILMCTGIFLVHGNKWIVLFGTLTYVLLLAAIVRAEEAHLLQAFGSAYEDYSRRIPRWLPRRASWIHALRMQAKRGKIAITGKGNEAIVWTNPCRVP
jgi:Phospholipid methyltransferase